MNRRARRRTRTQVVVQSVVSAAIGFAFVALILVVFGSGDDGIEEADVGDDALSVAEVLELVQPDDQVVVTGFVFVGERRTILCSARNDDDPPFCEGLSIDLRNLDPNRLDVAIPDDAPAWSRDEVTVAGNYTPGLLVVTEVLQS